MRYTVSGGTSPANILLVRKFLMTVAMVGGVSSSLAREYRLITPVDIKSAGMRKYSEISPLIRAAVASLVVPKPISSIFP